MANTARKRSGRASARETAGWLHPKETADRYLLAAGVSLPEVREALIGAAADSLEFDDRSTAPRIRGIRMLACVERMLCERLGAISGDKTADPDTARRLLFTINPTPEAQLALLKKPPRESAGPDRSDESFVPIPPVRRRKPMPRQSIAFRYPPFWGLRVGRGA